MKGLIIATLAAIVLSLVAEWGGWPSQYNKRMVTALSIRVGLSVALFVLLLISWHFGLIEPHGS